MFAQMMNMGLLTPPGNWSSANNLTVLIVHEGAWAQTAFAVALPER